MLKRVLPFQSFTSVESGFTTETSYSRPSVSLSLPFPEQLNAHSFPSYLYSVLKTLNRLSPPVHPSPTLGHVTILVLGDSFLSTRAVTLAAPC